MCAEFEEEGRGVEVRRRVRMSVFLSISTTARKGETVSVSFRRRRRGRTEQNEKGKNELNLGVLPPSSLQSSHSPGLITSERPKIRIRRRVQDPTSQRDEQQRGR